MNVHGGQSTGGTGDQLVDCVNLRVTPAFITPTNCPSTHNLLSSSTSSNSSLSPSSSFSLYNSHSEQSSLLTDTDEPASVIFVVQRSIPPIHYFLFSQVELQLYILLEAVTQHPSVSTPSVRSSLNSIAVWSRHN